MIWAIYLISLLKSKFKSDLYSLLKEDKNVELLDALFLVKLLYKY